MGNFFFTNSLMDYCILQMNLQLRVQMNLQIQNYATTTARLQSSLIFFVNSLNSLKRRGGCNFPDVKKRKKQKNTEGVIWFVICIFVAQKIAKSLINLK